MQPGEFRSDAAIVRDRFRRGTDFPTEKNRGLPPATVTSRDCAATNLARCDSVPRPEIDTAPFWRLACRAMAWVWVPDKVEYPPLFPAELRPFTVAELRALCVDGFPLSDTRDVIMSCLEHVCSILAQAGIVGDLWVDGSFLTQKIDPEDADVVLVVRSEFLDAATTEQREAVDWFADEFGELKRWLRCHCYPLVMYPDGHAMFWSSTYRHAYWLRQWGFSRANVLKGIAVVKLNP